jgi:hypothetical protein
VHPKAEVDLEQITTRDTMLEWIFHISEKQVYITREDVGYLVQALAEVIDPHTTFTGGPVDMHALLEKKYKQ